MDVLKPWEAGFAGADASSTLGGHRIFEFAVAGAADGASTNGVAYLQISHDAALPADTARHHVRVAVAREGNVTVYQLDFPWDQLGVSSPMKPGDAFGFALAVNDIDPGRKARRHGLRLFDGIVNEKSPRQYGPSGLPVAICYHARSMPANPQLPDLPSPPPRRVCARPCATTAPPS